MALNNSFQWTDIGIFNALIPKEGPKALQTNLDFTVQGVYNVDLLLQQQRKQLSVIQTIYIDNSNGANPVTIVVRGTGQNIICPPKAQGFFPALVANPPQFTITSAGAIVNIAFINVPVPAAVWSSLQNGFPTAAGGAVSVVDAVLESIISGNFANVAENVYGNNDIVYKKYAGSNLFSASITAVGPTAFGPAGVAGNFITSLECWVSGNASLAAAGELLITIADSTAPATVIAQGSVILPNVAAAGALPPLKCIDLDNMQATVKSAGARFQATLSAALTAGRVIINVSGGITATVG